MLNKKRGFITVILYFFGSIFLGLIAVIFFGGIKNGDGKTYIESAIDSGMYANLMMSAVLTFVVFKIFKNDIKDIFFERKKFNLSKLYFLIPIIEVLIIIFAFVNVQFSLIPIGSILLVFIASISIGFNEEVVTRGIFITGLRKDKIDEWKVYVLTLALFSVLHLVNLLGGGTPMEVVYQIIGANVFYVTRRVTNSLFFSIALHGVYDTVFTLLPGPYPANQAPPDRVLDIQLGSVLLLTLVFILFIIFGRGIFKNETVGFKTDS